MNVPDVTSEFRFVPGQQEQGFRSVLFVPMVRDAMSIGVIGVSRMVVGPFPENQVELLQTFADQAVIAIDNVRLFNETKEALEQQTATVPAAPTGGGVRGWVRVMAWGRGRRRGGAGREGVDVVYALLTSPGVRRIIGLP